MLVNEEQPSNASYPMLVTLFGIVMLVNELQQKKASQPMLVTLSGIVILVHDSQPENANVTMHVTPFGMSYAPVFSRGQQINSVFSLLNSTPSSLE